VSVTTEPKLKRINVYVNPDDLQRVALALRCRPSEAVRRLIDNYLRITELDAISQMPGAAPYQVFRTSDREKLPPIPEDEEIEPVE